MDNLMMPCDFVYKEINDIFLTLLCFLCLKIEY